MKFIKLTKFNTKLKTTINISKIIVIDEIRKEDSLDSPIITRILVDNFNKAPLYVDESLKKIENMINDII